MHKSHASGFVFRFFLPLSLAAALLHPVPRLDASMVRLVSLEEMVQLADRIFVGRCVAVESRRDERGVPVTYATFVVVEAIKGQLDAKVTIKQIGSQAPGPLYLPDLPRYAVGEEALLFLHGTSPYGFTSPVGLQQGKWRVVRSRSGKRVLERGIAASLPRKGSGALYGLGEERGYLPYADFIVRLKQMAGR